MADGVSWGILGTGQIAGAFARELQLTGHRVGAVGSRSRVKAESFAAQFAIATAYGSYEALAADPDIDVIYIATPHPMHAANATLALAAGKHVLVEKPFTLNAREAQAVVTLAATNRLVALEAMKTRFLPHMVSIRDVVASGALGEIRSVIADLTQDLPNDPTHRLNALELGGGALLDLGIYPISFAWDVLGEPRDIKATARFKATGADSQVAALFTYPTGAVAMILAASDGLGSNRAAIVGTEGRIEIDPQWNKPTSFRIFDSKNRVISQFNATVAGMGLEFEADEVERLILAGSTESETLPPSETVAIMGTLDTIRAQIGLKYPNE
jgi:predicted dehydrogenase